MGNVGIEMCRSCNVWELQCGVVMCGHCGVGELHFGELHCVGSHYSSNLN